MVLLMILFVILGIFVFITKFRNSYTWMYVTMIVLIETELIFTLFLYVKMYDFSTLYEWEKPFHFFLSKFKMNYYTMFDVLTYAIAGYMAMSMMVALHEMKKGIKKRILIFVLALPALVFAVINSHYMNVKLYVEMYSTTSPVLHFAAHFINTYNIVTLISYIVLPFIVFVVNIYRAKITYLKKQLAVRSLYLLIIDLMGAFIFVQYVPYKNILTYAPDYLRFPKYEHFNGVHTDLLWLVIITAVLLVFAVLAIKSKMFDKIDIRKQYKRKSPQKTKIPFRDTRSVFHTCKNILLSVDFIGKSMEQKNPPPEIMEDIEAMHKQIKNGLGRLTHILNLYNSQTEIIEDVNLIDCIDTAIAEAKIPKEIDIMKYYSGTDIYISADSLLMEEALINLFKNASDAISQKSDTNGRIDIRILTERSWVCMYIRDNGCGIMRKNYKRIFNPLFSTKKTAKNWGVGLSFVLSTINSLGGQISFRSKYGKFTEFEILLPMAKRQVCQIKEREVEI